MNEMPPIGWDSGRWSTSKEIEAFVEWVGENSPFVVRTVAETRRGNKLQALEIGTGPADRTMMITCGMHGTEKPSRECGPLFLRELISRLQDADVVQWLANNRLILMPNTNPDGHDLNSYGNSRGVDPAQDGFRLQEIERQAIEEMWVEHEPLFVQDHHMTTSPGLPHQAFSDGNRGESVHPQIAALSADKKTHLAASFGERDWQLGTYYRPAARSIMHTAAFRHTVAYLIEGTNTVAGINNPALQVDMHVFSMWDALTWFEKKVSDLQSARAASLHEAMTAAGPEKVSYTELLLPDGQKMALPIDGYDLLSPLPEVHERLWGIETVGNHVPIRQPARGFLSEIMGPTPIWEDRIVLARTHLAAALLPGAPTAYVKVAGVVREVTSAFVMDDGARKPVAFHGVGG